jgi:hypothetical protein
MSCDGQDALKERAERLVAEIDHKAFQNVAWEVEFLPDVAREIAERHLRESQPVWHPIVDAPRNAPVLLFSPHSEDLNAPGGLIWVSGGMYDVGGWRGEYGKPAPTHFQLLPAPPEAEESK